MEGDTTDRYIFTDRKWLLVFGGYSKDRGGKQFLALLYQWVVVTLMLLSMSVSCALGSLLSADDQDSMIISLHFALMFVAFVLSHISRIFSEKVTDKAVNDLRAGLHHYTSEDPDPFVKELRRTTHEKMTRNLNGFIVLAVGVTVGNEVLRPLILYLLADKPSTDKAVNPYILVPLYLPFDTYSAGGFICAWLISLFPSVLTITAIGCVEEIFIGSTTGLWLELEILNRSLRLIEKRAYRRMLKMENVTGDDGLYDQQDFQDSMYACLRENVRHHQAILRLHANLKDYIGQILLILASLASAVFAVMCLAIIQKLNTGGDMMVAMSFTGTVVFEIFFAFRLCYFGQLVTDKSEELYGILYSSPWVCCNKKFKTVFLIMLNYAKEPIKVKSHIISFYASYQSFSDIITTMYQLLNLAREALEG